MHYFSPVEKMPLVEVVATKQTASWVITTCVALAKKQGKTVIVVGDGPGFYTSRILAPYLNEGVRLVAEGNAVDAVDAALMDFGFPVGPLTLIDEIGLDVCAKAGKVLHEALGERLAPPAAMAALIGDERRGRKNARGFYHYHGGKKGGVDASIYGLLSGASHEGQSRSVAVANQRAIQAMQDRCVLAMINEAVLCLSEGILRSARDGDIGAVFGLGFPPFTGGPFAYLEARGAAEVVARLDALASQPGPRLAAAEGLRAHVARRR
jgi:3-hydroxyacyl-CoA dehydrogenase/enoyl-CoA hydratase/3-hydroxybutyryl-CoA epimerase